MNTVLVMQSMLIIAVAIFAYSLGHLLGDFHDRDAHDHDTYFRDHWGE